MDRYVGEKVQGDRVYFGAQEENHILRANRLKEGDALEVLHEGRLYACHIFSRDPLCALIDSLIEEDSEPRLKCHLAFSLLKGDRSELIVQKGTELGVSSFHPFLSLRSIIRLDGKKSSSKKERLLAVALAAAGQCHRLMVPEVAEVLPFKDVLDNLPGERLIAYEGELGSGDSLLEALKDAHEVSILIGPEGGFATEEVELAKSKGYRPISLGKRILRAETAAIYAASICSALGD